MRQQRLQQRSHVEQRGGFSWPGVYYHLMIQVIVNGSAQHLETPLALDALLEQMSLKGKKVAVEKNGEIVPRSAHGNTLIADGDQLEIVVAVGGG
jgi:sulfur carrier protein